MKNRRESRNDNRGHNLISRSDAYRKKMEILEKCSLSNSISEKFGKFSWVLSLRNYKNSSKNLKHLSPQMNEFNNTTSNILIQNDENMQNDGNIKPSKTFGFVESICKNTKINMTMNKDS